MPGIAITTERLSTGTKVFLILGVVLLPFAILASIMSGSSDKRLEIERQMRFSFISAALAESINADIVRDLSTLTTLANLDADKAQTYLACDEVKEVIKQRDNGLVYFAVTDPSGSNVCSLGWQGPSPSAQNGLQRSPTFSAIINGNMLQVTRKLSTGYVIATQSPLKIFAVIIGTSEILSPYTIEIGGTTQKVTIIDKGGKLLSMSGQTQIEQPIGSLGLTLRLTVQNPPPSIARLSLFLLPVAMWLVSAVIGWLVVDRLFTRDLRMLTRAVANYVPGQIIPVDALSEQSAPEVRTLGYGLSTMSQLVADNLAQINEGLNRQTALTREVHHRVKNNLQVVSSLINLHARGEHASDIESAYRLIQRRVDALSVVHRNHFAGYEDSHGVSLSALLGELTSLLQISSQSEPWPIEIMLEIGAGAVNQDTAISIAFLVTELTELAMYSANRQTTLLIQSQSRDGGTAILTFKSPSYRTSKRLERQLQNQYDRILTGLSRQLRAPLEHDGTLGSYRITIPLISADGIV